MKKLSSKLKIFLCFPVAALLLLGGPFTQNAHAQSAGMSHDMGSMQVKSCAGPCVPSAVLREEQTVNNEDDENPQPPEPSYLTHLQADFPDPDKPSGLYVLGALVLRPPDMVKLYGNYRF